MRVALALLCLAASPSLVAAEPTRDVGAMHTDDCARARKAKKDCVLDMGKEDIEADRLKKPGDDIVVPDWAKVGSLIRLRRDFITEILKSAEDL